MTSIFYGLMSTKRRMSRLELSETVRTLVARREAVVIDTYAYVNARRLGRYWGNMR